MTDSTHCVTAQRSLIDPPTCLHCRRGGGIADELYGDKPAEPLPTAGPAGGAVHGAGRRQRTVRAEALENAHLPISSRRHEVVSLGKKRSHMFYFDALFCTVHTEDEKKTQIINKIIFGKKIDFRRTEVRC